MVNLPLTQPEVLFLLPVISCLLCSATSLILRKGVVARALTSLLTSLSSVLMLVVALMCALFGVRIRLSIATGLWGSSNTVPWPLNTIVFGIDGLSATFVLMLGIVGLASSIYSLSYLRRFEGEYDLRFFGVNYSLFILLMYLVVTVRDLFWFFIFWELMTLTSQFLVSFEYRRRVAVAAGLKYFTLTKVLAELMIAGGVAVIVLGGLPHGTGFREVATSLNAMLSSEPVIAMIAIGLFFAGLMVKASLTPLHVWLPDAHPEAPSNVSALLSGIMIKVSVYMMFRLFLFFSPPNLLWGAILSFAGAATLTYGTMMALKQVDSKRLLAYHSVGQIGYVVLGLGACVTLLSMSPPNPALAAVAALASLYHALNHAVFKSLLFLNAGSVEYVTGTRDLNVLGGLGKVMPATALTALIASFSIAGIPPFNGFVSKWLIYSSTMTVRGYLPVLGFLALFISSVTTASFIKFYTSIFGKPSRKSFSNAREVPASMLVAQLLLASLCVLLGVLPGLAFTLLKPALVSAGLSIAGLGVSLTAFSIPSVAINYPTLIAATLFPVAGVIYAVLSGKEVHGIEGWACGALRSPHSLSPPAKSYYEVFEEEFRGFYRVGEALYDYVVIRGSQALRAILRGAQHLTESPSPMSALTALVLMVALLLCLTLKLMGVMLP